MAMLRSRLQRGCERVLGLVSTFAGGRRTLTLQAHALNDNAAPLKFLTKPKLA